MHGNAANSDHQSNTAASRKPCQYFLRTGWCGFGSGCHFSHCPPPLAAAAAASNEGDVSRTRSDAVHGDGKVRDAGEQRETVRQKQCWYFKRGRCHFGDKCRQRHTMLADQSREQKPRRRSGRQNDKDTGEDVENVRPVSDPHLSSTASQNHTQEARTTTPAVSSLVPKVDETRDMSDKLETLRATEIKQLRLRYPKALIEETEDGCTTAKFVFEPSDPDWVTQLHCCLSVCLSQALS